MQQELPSRACDVATRSIVSADESTRPGTSADNVVALTRATRRPASLRAKLCHLVPVVAFLLLSSCTPVSDFGAYWDKGFVDPALEGRWKKIGIPGQDLDSIPGADQLLFVKDGSSYSWQGINPVDSTLSADDAAQREKDNDARWALRTLRIGSHLFLAIRAPEGKQNGMLYRYEVQGDLLLEEVMDNGPGVDFLEEKHPTATNIHKNKSEGSYVVIDTFDDEVFRILSEISDDPAYWYLECQYQKLP